MKMRVGTTLTGAALIAVLAGTAYALDADLECNICTCQSGEIVCVQTAEMEVLEEQQVICGNACATIGSTHGSRETVPGPCAEVPECRPVGAPAANPLWLAAAAAGLLIFGGLALRRSRRRSEMGA